MTLETRNGSIIQDVFGLRDNTPPTLDAPIATVEQRYDGTDTWLDVTITTPVAGADGYVVTVIDNTTQAVVGTGLIDGVEDVAEEAVKLNIVADTTKLLFQIKAVNGLAYQGSLDQTPIIALVEVDPPVITATTVGDSFIITPPVWNIDPESQTFIIEESDDDAATDPYTEVSPTPTQATDEVHYRVVFTAFGPAGDGPIVSTSASTGLIVAAPVGLEQLDTTNIIMGDSVYWPDTQSTWFKPTITLVDVPVGNVVEWTGVSPISYPNDPPEASWHELEELEPDVWVPAFDTLDTDAVTRPPNFALWRADPDSPDRSWLRFRHYDPLNPGVYSPISLPAWFVEEPAEVIPDPADLVYRQYLRRSPGRYGVTPDLPHLYADGLFSEDCGQWWPSFAWSADGSKIALGQDVAQVMLSRDSGLSWYRPQQIGLKCLAVSALAADPVNTSRWLFHATAGFQTTKTAAFSGIYVTDDDFETVTMVKSLPATKGPRWIKETLTCFPASGGATAKWYIVVQNEGESAGSFCKSGSNNGTSWGAATSVAWNTFGRIYKLQASPHTAGRLFIGCHTGGLRRSTDDGATFPVMPGDLPPGPVHWFWIDPDDASHMYCTLTSGAATRGLYECTNATAVTPHWERIRDCPAHHASVGAARSGASRSIYVKCGNIGTSLANDTDHIRLSNGSTWITRNTAAPNRILLNFAGAQSDLQPYRGMCNEYTTLDGGSGQEQTFALAHPTDPDQCIILGRTAILRTTDAGLNVNISSSGYGGAIPRGIHYSLLDKNLVALSLHDIIAGKSLDGLKTTIGKIVNPGLIHAKANTISGIAIDSFTGRSMTQLPNDSSVADADWRGRIIGTAGDSGANSGVMYYIDADGTYGDWMGDNPTQGQSNATGGGWVNRFSTGFLRHDPNKVWSGTNNINLAVGTTWGTTPNNRVILGAAQDGTDTMYAFTGQTIYRATTWDGAWSTFYTFTGADVLAGGGGAPIGGCSEYDGRRMFIKHGTRSFKMLFDDDGTPEVTTFNLEGSIAGTTIFDTPYEIDASISHIRGDLLDERYLYIATSTMGTDKRVFRLKFNAGFTGFTECTNITSNGPRGATVITLFSTGLHGCLHTVHNGMGSYIFPTPTDWQPRVGAFKFTGQPTNGQNIVINGQTWTFVTSGATGPQTNIGGSLSATLTQLATDLNASVDADITPCTYTARYGNLLEVTMDSPTIGVDEPFVLDDGTTTNATVINNVTVCRDRMWLDCPLPIYEL